MAAGTDFYCLPMEIRERVKLNNLDSFQISGKNFVFKGLNRYSIFLDVALINLPLRRIIT
jgi:hypothetical protein